MFDYTLKNNNSVLHLTVDNDAIGASFVRLSGIKIYAF